MPPWKLKAAVQGALSLAPRSRRLNEILQRYVTRSLRLTDVVVDEKWAKCRRHLRTFAALSGRDARPEACLELGTGWYPLVPVGLALATGARVLTVDTSDLLSRRRVLATYEAFVRLAERTECPFAPDTPRHLLALGRARPRLGARELLALAGVRVLVADARALPLAAGSIDLFVSNNTLEHIRGPELSGILRELRRLCSEGGVMSHHIDLADHYALFDRSIGELNFLRYSSRVWPLFNNPLQYQNRLRLSDYQRIHAEAGWQVVESEGRRARRADLETISPAPEFRGYDADDLRICEAWIGSRPSR